MIQDLSGSWCIKGTGESTVVMDSPVLLMYHDQDRSWITDPDPDHPNGTQPLRCFLSVKYGWRNGAKFTKFIFIHIHIQCSY